MTSLSAHRRPSATLLALGVLAAALLVASCHAAPVAVYVATNGSDTAAGTTPATAVASLTAALAKVHALRGTNPTAASPATIHVAAGWYNPGAATLTLSGAKDSYLTVVGDAGAEQTTLSGGIRLNAQQFEAQSNGVVTFDLGKAGVTNYGTLLPGGLGTCANDKTELFVNNTRAVLARWPNIAVDGMWQWVNIKSVVNATTFVANTSRVMNWANEPDAWIHGYWSFDWADSYVQIQGIDAGNVVRTNPKTAVLYGLQPKARFYGVNLLSELDAPNEYYLNRTSGILYYMPVVPLDADTEIAVSSLEAVISATNVVNFHLTGLRIVYARTTGVIIQNSVNTTVDNCDISMHGAAGLEVTGSNATIANNVMSQFGCQGIIIAGGDEATLTPGNIVVSQNQISAVARWKRTYMPAIAWSGVGNSFMYNELSDSPHTGILGTGNNCLFEGNTVSDMCYEVSDSGAWYSGRSWAKRGHVLQHNTFRNIRTTERIFLGAPSVQAVYFDDQLSGNFVYNNTFEDCEAGMLVGGGRRHIIRSNNFIRNGIAIHFDNRGMNWQKAACAPGGMFMQELTELHYQQPPWSVAYPTLVNITNDHPCVPVYNVFQDNTYCSTPTFLDRTDEVIDSWLSKASGNVDLGVCPASPTK